MASSPLICDITPVDGVNITIKTDNISQDFEIEWRDSRCLPSSSDADVSRNATPRAFNENSRNMMGLVTLLQRIVFGELVDDKLGSGCKQARNRYSSRETGVTYIHLQHRTSRHLVQKIEVCTDTAGDLVKACLLNDTREPTLLKSPLAILKQLGKMCSNEEGWTLIRPVVWADLPSELWWHVLKNMTAKEGSAMACTFSTIPNIIRNQNFVWLPSELHLVLLTAQEAVRCDPSTHLPLNLQQGEFKIGRSRTNDVVLLRDPEVSKRHCKIWRDARGDVYIQDLASTNGTKLNGDWLRPVGEGNDRAPSAPRKMVVGDQVTLGLTTLQLEDGPCPPHLALPAASSPAVVRHDGQGNATSPSS